MIQSLSERDPCGIDLHQSRHGRSFSPMIYFRWVIAALQYWPQFGQAIIIPNGYRSIGYIRANNNWAGFLTKW